MMLEDTGFVDVRIGPAADTFGGADGEEKARTFEVYGYAFLARRPGRPTHDDVPRRKLPPSASTATAPTTSLGETAHSS
jgi:hypothetical protein